MKKRINIDNPFFSFMGRLGDIVIVNLLFLVCSLPVLTMGAALAALYQTVGEMRGKCFLSSFRSFFGAFRRALKCGFLPWIVQLFTGVLLVFDLMVTVKAGDTLLWHISGMVLGGLLLLWLFCSCYLLPARIYEGRTLKEALARSIYLAVGNLQKTLLMTLLNVIPAVCFVLGEAGVALATPIYVTVGFGVTAYLNTILLEECRGIGETEEG